jgi:hypothetical protein
MKVPARSGTFTTPDIHKTLFSWKKFLKYQVFQGRSFSFDQNKHGPEQDYFNY